MSEYERVTKKGGFTKDLDLTQELGYSHIYNHLSALEDKIENGQFGDIVDYKHRIKVLERALKK